VCSDLVKASEAKVPASGNAATLVERAGSAMKRFRLSTLMLLIVIAALVVALAVQQQRAARREAELQNRLNDHRKAQFSGLNILPDYMKK
jgi:hypothetical protein